MKERGRSGSTVTAVSPTGLAGSRHDADSITAHVTALAARAIAAARDAGDLEPMVRSRLAPFWESPEVAGLLGD